MPVVEDNKQMILLDTVYQSLYLTLGRASETVEWHRVIRAAAIDNGISLEDQQLTKDDIPVIVDKCVNFVYAHGTYRGAFSSSDSGTRVFWWRILSSSSFEEKNDVNHLRARVEGVRALAYNVRKFMRNESV